MSHLVIARKFRPQTFSEVAGQVQVTKTLANAIKRDKVAHAMVFAGPRGVGKTSLARIFAKALNCEKGPTSEPCGVCSNCKSVTIGNSLAVREIDGASHNSVDNVRDLIETFRALPPPGWRFKVYIIDEVHMLSVSAFNALLKSLEEPPPNTVFILATTEVHKIPETVLSRCQRHDFRELPLAQIEARLGQILEVEKQKYEPRVLRIISRAADGSMRDAQTLLERVIAYSEGAITESEVAEVLGLVERPALVALMKSILNRDATAVLKQISTIFSSGIDPQMLCKEFAGLLRETMLTYFYSGKAELDALGIADSEVLREIASVKSAGEFVALYDMIRDGLESCLRSSFARASFEALLVRAALAGSAALSGNSVAKPSSANTGVLQGQPKSAESRGASAENSGVTSNASEINSSSSLSRPTMQGSSARGNAAVAFQPLQSQPEQNKFPPNTPVQNLAVKTQDSAISWSEFIADASKRGAPLLVEHLRRLTPDEFQGGLLRASGPDFSVTALLSDVGRRKLEELLSKYSGIEKWRLDLKRSENINGSLVAQEKEQKQKLKETKEQSLAQHAALEQIKKLFPGSTIESIKTDVN